MLAVKWMRTLSSHGIELVAEIVNACKKDWDVSRRLEADKGHMTLNLRDMLKAHIVE